MPTRFVVFVLIVSTILLATNAFVFATWNHFFGLTRWMSWEAGPFLLSLAFVAATVIGFRNTSLLLRTVYAVSASWLGALNFAFFAAVACWIAAGAAWLVHLPVTRGQIGSVFFSAALLATIAGLINAMWIRTTRIELRLPHLPETWRGKTAALVTDLHLGHLSGPWFLGRVIRRLRLLQPDIVFISGDLFDGTTAGLDNLVAPWKEFSAPWGMFYVTGNHDEFAERTLYLSAVERTGIRVLHNEKVVVHGLALIGIHDSEVGNPQELRRLLAEANLGHTQPSILLAHQPINLPVAEAAGVSLQLSGHTHKGQMWPWSLLVRRIYGRFGYGLHRLGKMQVYTSSGVGTWGPPLRLGTKSEIVLFHFT